jgi:hypothetical protein
VILHGEIRIVPGRGLSLRYREPEEHVIIVDDHGVLLRDGNGRERAMPADSRAQAAIAAMVDVLRFDLTALQKSFAVHGRRDGEAWTLAFVPSLPEIAATVGTLEVHGEGARLVRLAMIKSPTQRIEIAIGETKEDVVFTGDALQRFFR